MDAARLQRIHGIRDDIADFYTVLMAPENQVEPDYLEDVRRDIRDMEEALTGVEAFAYTQRRRGTPSSPTHFGG